jgi:hypothetical protein
MSEPSFELQFLKWKKENSLTIGDVLVINGELRDKKNRKIKVKII